VKIDTEILTKAQILFIVATPELLLTHKNRRPRFRLLYDRYVSKCHYSGNSTANSLVEIHKNKTKVIICLLPFRINN